MATVMVKRPARRPPPEMPSGEVVLEAPPEIPAPSGRQWTHLMSMLPMIAVMAAILIMFSGGIAGGLRIAVFGLFAVAMLGMAVMAFVNGAGPGKREMGQARRQYLRRLAQHRVRLLRTVRRQRVALYYLHPDPEALQSVVAGSRLWERRPEDGDFAVTRVGVGPQSPATTLVAPDTLPLEQLEPLSALALRRFITTYGEIPDLPLAVAVTGFGHIHVRGDRSGTAGLVRSMLAQLAALHAPDDLRVAVCVDAEARAHWEWVKWLPHALHPHRTDALGPVRLVASSVAGIEAMLEDLLAQRPRFDPAAPRGARPHLVVVLDGGRITGSAHLMAGLGVEGVTIIDLTTAPPRALDRAALVFDVAAGGRLTATTIEGETELGRADTIDLVTVEGLARQLAPLRLTTATRAEQPLHELGLAELLDLGDPYAFDPARWWGRRPGRDRLRVMFGMQPDGSPIELDLKESAQDGMGPHGLLIGATGSGKSELLRTLVLTLALTHPPNSLNFALVDFKGGATFNRLDKLPHTSAVITNLKDELPLVDRMTDAISGELIRRQELLRASGNFSSLHEYEKARAAGAPLPEVPTLLVICDEFSELLTAKPDFIDMFVQIGRVGRALGVHLLLASQRLEEGRLRGLDVHLSFRLALKTFSAMESRTVLGVNDAYELPRAPGHGFLKFGTEPLMRFRSAYVSGVYRRAASTPGAVRPHAPDFHEYSTSYVAAPVPVEEENPVAAEDDAVGESLLDVLVDRLEGRGTPAHQVWLPPLSAPPSLDGLLGPLGEDPARGLCATSPEHNGKLRAVAGIVDRPFDQRRDPLVFDFSSAAGHFVVMGAPRSGRSTALRTVIMSLAVTHTPRETQFYCIDFGGGSLAALRGLPHVGGVAGRQHPAAVRRTVAEVMTVLTERERRFADHEIDGVAAYREARARGEFADDPFGDVFLVIDGWPTLRKEFDDLEDRVSDIAARGLAYGVHVFVACSRWFDLRPAIRDLFGSKVELRLGDPIDTTVDKAAALTVPLDSPGRGVTASKHQSLMALPRADGVEADTGLSQASAALVAAIARAWRGERAPSVRLLPPAVPYPDLPAQDNDLQLTIGIAEHDLRPVRIDFAADPHFLLLGDAESGKTAFLRMLARRIVDSYAPSEARILMIDHRRGLLGEVNSDHLIGYGTDLAGTKRLIGEAARGMAERLPGTDVTPEQLRARSWWRGPELFVLVDDHDMVATPHDDPFAPLMEYLPQGRDIGLHVVLARRTGGAGRALFAPFLSRLRDVGSPGLLLSGDKDEGPLLGGLKPEPLPAGRGRFVTRKHAPQLVQLAWLPPTG
ncbi:DNA segregation ATPase FtsK/SpoIIIE, S-DNA-T family [Lentzea albidocapillata subsp. violacea]|uniref:DNA segregation ATPase FtsK/SpoIIIE, S-DNA-T family n=1 Tax=Lentzea albidocapillata subsp. violacea TaxID=128104 RepID=A0A1G8YGT3_9PSEU|nr:type VII secretion protein EccCa [Lentzea albidocapillata]SDK01956.1 DNA segregation ATPase FtsK/SpoIIIE, S-DNA-T family [Lentzea albidocapillata subsp. violacea]